MVKSAPRPTYKIAKAIEIIFSVPIATVANAAVKANPASKVKRVAASKETDLKPTRSTTIIKMNESAAACFAPSMTLSNSSWPSAAGPVSLMVISGQSSESKIFITDRRSDMTLSAGKIWLKSN